MYNPNSIAKLTSNAIKRTTKMIVKMFGNPFMPGYNPDDNYQAMGEQARQVQLDISQTIGTKIAYTSIDSVTKATVNMILWAEPLAQMRDKQDYMTTCAEISLKGFRIANQMSLDSEPCTPNFVPTPFYGKADYVNLGSDYITFNGLQYVVMKVEETNKFETVFRFTGKLVEPSALGVVS